MKRFIIASLIICFGMSNVPLVSAEEIAPAYEFEASVGQNSLNRDLSFNAFDNLINIGLPAGQLTAPAVIRLSQIHEPAKAPNGFSDSPILYQIDIPATAFAQGRFFISLKSSGSDKYKQLYFFDKNSAEGWRPLPTNENFGKGVISTYLTMPFSRLALFESNSAIVKGKASWYKYKNGLFAASPDFPKGSRLRVINLDNRKSVDVVVNDFGPNRSLHPDRVVDLDAVAFARLAPLGQGMMNNIAVEKLPDHIGSLSAPLSAPTDPNELSVSAKAAIVFNSADKTVLWSKAEDSVLPLASLTKLAAVKIFLETKPDLNKVVAYSIKDEQLNNLYVPASQSARLRLKDGDTLPLKDFVYASLIGSTNNTVETLVRFSGLTRESFIARMNARVKQWGATQTRFVEPTGLSPKNVTTARDYVIIAREAFLDPTIASASVRPSYSLTTRNTKTAHNFKNTNLIARETGSELLGSKTGYLDEAGHCLVTKWPTSKNKNVIVVLFGEPSRQASVDDTKILMSFATQYIK